MGFPFSHLLPGQTNSNKLGDEAGSFEFLNKLLDPYFKKNIKLNLKHVLDLHNKFENWKLR